MPGQGAAEPGHADRTERVLRDGLVGQPLVLGFAVRPGDEGLDPPVQRRAPYHSLALLAAGAVNVVVSGAEEEFALGDHSFQDADGTYDRGDRDPGDVAYLAGGGVVAVVVKDALEVVAADQVSARGAVGGRLGGRAAARAQGLNFLGTHAGEVADHDGGCCTQVLHQRGGFTEGDVVAPGAALDLSGDWDVQGAGSRPLKDEVLDVVQFDESLDLGVGGSGVRCNVVAGQVKPALDVGCGQRYTRVDQREQVLLECGPARRGGGVVRRHVDQSALFGPGREDVFGEVIDDPQCPDEPRAQDLWFEWFGRVLRVVGAVGGVKVVVDALGFPRRAADPCGAGA